MSETIKAPGGEIVYGQAAKDYFADPGLGRTDLLQCAQSPAKFKAGVDAKAGKRAWAGESAEEEGE